MADVDVEALALLVKTTWDSVNRTVVMMESGPSVVIGTIRLPPLFTVVTESFQMQLPNEKAPVLTTIGTLVFQTVEKGDNRLSLSGISSDFVTNLPFTRDLFFSDEYKTFAQEIPLTVPCNNSTSTTSVFQYTFFNEWELALNLGGKYTPHEEEEGGDCIRCLSVAIAVEVRANLFTILFPYVVRNPMKVSLPGAYPMTDLFRSYLRLEKATNPSIVVEFDKSKRQYKFPRISLYEDPQIITMLAVLHESAVEDRFPYAAQIQTNAFALELYLASLNAPVMAVVQAKCKLVGYTSNVFEKRINKDATMKLEQLEYDAQYGKAEIKKKITPGHPYFPYKKQFAHWYLNPSTDPSPLYSPSYSASKSSKTPQHSTSYNTSLSRNNSYDDALKPHVYDD